MSRMLLCPNCAEHDDGPHGFVIAIEQSIIAAVCTQCEHAISFRLSEPHFRFVTLNQLEQEHGR